MRWFLWTGLLLASSLSVAVAEPGENEAVGLGGGPLTLQWKTDVGRSIVYQPVLIPEGLLTVSTDRKLYRHDLETGQKRWKRRFKEEIGTRPVYALLASGEERVFVYTGRSNGGRLRALHGGSGKDIWTRTLGSRPTSMAWAEGALWVLDVSGRLARIDPEQGNSTWHAEGLGWDPPQLLVDAGLIYVLSRQDSLRVFIAQPKGPPESDFGEEDRGVPTDDPTGDGGAAAAADDDEADVSGDDGMDVEIDQLWSIPVSGRFRAPPFRMGERILICSAEGRLLEIDAKNGQVLRTESRAAGQIFAGVAIGETIVTVSGDGHVEAAGTGGRWSFDVNAAVSAPPVGAEPLVLISTSLGELVALDLGTGDLAWKVELDNRLQAAPILTPRYLVLTTNRGDLFVYDHR